MPYKLCAPPSSDGVLHVTVPKRPPPTPRKPDVITIPVTDRYSVQTPPSPGADARGTSDLESPTSVLPPAAGLGAVSSPGSFGKRATGQQETKGRESPKEPPRTIPVV